MPPPSASAELLITALPVMVPPRKKIPPPFACEALPLTTLSEIAKVAPTVIPPPFKAALFPLIVLPSTVSVAPGTGGTAMPPPWPPACYH